MGSAPKTFVARCLPVRAASLASLLVATTDGCALTTVPSSDAGPVEAGAMHDAPRAADAALSDAALIASDAHTASDAIVQPVDTSTAPDADVPPEDLRRGHFSPTDVFLAGTLGSGACYLDAIADPRAPSVAVVGFDCYFDETSAMIAPDGTLLYVNTFEDVLREFHCDDCPGFEPTDTYPSDVLANDTIRPTPPCDPETNRLTAFRIAPDGEVLHSCGGVWYDDTGAEVARVLDIVAVSHGGLVLGFDEVPGRDALALLDRGTGAQTAVAGVPDCTLAAVRSEPTAGFWLAFECAGTDERWSIGPDGTARRDGAFPAYPAGYRGSGQAELAGDGSLWTFAGGPGSFEDAIVRRTIAGASELIYTEAMEPAPAVEIHISDLVTGP